VFSPTPNFESLNPLYVKEGDSATRKILVDGASLKGMYTSLEDLKWRVLNA
jgi:hypothetical protein